MNLKELSKKLHLSISTVSKALRDSPEISDATKEKVKAKAKKLNYHANPFASNLRNQQSKTIAVIIPEIANNFFSQAINGAESFAQDKDYHVLIYQTHEDVQKEISVAKHLLNGRVDGIMISISRQTKETAHLEALINNNIPLVFFDRVSENINAPKVTTNDYQSAFTGTEHLITAGCKRIAFLAFSNILAISNNRLEGYLAALDKHKIKIDKSLIISCGSDIKTNKKIITKLLTSSIKVDALFACVEELAIVSYGICEAIHLKIPKDIKVISYSNLNTASILNPALTTITQPAYEIGREAASVLFHLIDKIDIPAPLINTILKSTLIIRDSTIAKK